LICVPVPSPTAEAVGYYLWRIAKPHSLWLRLAALGWFCVLSPIVFNFFTLIHLDSP
jgi:hypothetical protein